MIRAVITADVDNSMKLSKHDLTRLINCVEQLTNTFLADGRVIVSEFFRGDGFQMVVTNPADALEIAMTIKASVNGLDNLDEGRLKRGQSINTDVTISIAIGDTNATENIRTNNEDVFVLSGRGLEALKEKKQSIGVFSNALSMQNELLTSLALWDFIMKTWTKKSAEVFSCKLKGRLEKEIAEELGISQPAVNHRATRAGWTPYTELLARYKQLIKENHG